MTNPLSLQYPLLTGIQNISDYHTTDLTEEECVVCRSAARVHGTAYKMFHGNGAEKNCNLRDGRVFCSKCKPEKCQGCLEQVELIALNDRDEHFNGNTQVEVLDTSHNENRQVTRLFCERVKVVAGCCFGTCLFGAFIVWLVYVFQQPPPESGYGPP